MNKKRFLIFLFFLAIISITLIFVFLSFKKDDRPVSITVANEESDINLFYYRSVPGLKVAEEEGLVKTINKSLDISGSQSKLVIDKMWYNTKNVYIFYHVLDETSEIYLGGSLFLPSQEPSEITTYWGNNSIGSHNEKGIVYKGDFYSCLKLPPIKDQYRTPLAEVETLVFHPYINTMDPKDKKIKSTDLKTFEISLNYDSTLEEATKIPVESHINLDDRKINIYQVDIEPSTYRIYFQYLNSNMDKVYRVNGRYITDKGDAFEFDAKATAITDYPYHYTLELPPAHIYPKEIKLYIDSIYCIGVNNFTYEVPTNEYNNKNGTYDVKIKSQNMHNSKLTINKFILGNDYFEVFFNFSEDDISDEVHTLLDIKSPILMSNENSITKDLSNIITVKNEKFDYYDIENNNYGLEIYPKSIISIKLSRSFWDESEKVVFDLYNLSYEYKINRETIINLDSDDAIDD